MWRPNRTVVRRGIGGLLILHGLAHTLPGMRATDLGGGGPFDSAGLIWLLTALWALGALGYLAAGIGLLGVPPARRHWQRALWLGAGASAAMLLASLGGPWSILGLALDVGILAALAAGVLQPLDPPVETARPRGRMISVAFVAYVVLLILLRPWHMRWGSTDAELRMPLPGDEMAANPTYQIQHAVLIYAPPEQVWPWVAQIGHDRGGFYSYAWLENAFGLDVRNADRLHPEWQAIAAGDSVRATPDDYLGTGRRFGWRVARAEPNRVLVLEAWGAFVLEPVDCEHTRLIVRTRGNGGMGLADVVLAPVGLLVFEPAHFIMERRMLLGIKERAQRAKWKSTCPEDRPT